VRALIRTLTAIALATSVAGLVTPAQATPSWVSTVSWTNLNVKSEVGVFQRYRREFDANSVLQTQSETQHNQAWIRSDRNSVTVTYTGGKSNAGKEVRFILDGDQDFTYSTDNSVVAAANTSALPTNLDVITDGSGNAAVTLTLTEANAANRADDVLRAGISDGANTAGNMVLLWEPAGYFPVVKLVGTGTGPEATCNTLHPFECNDTDLTEETWAWSVFKKDWLPEYSQVYVKSYLAGATIGLRYKVTDIWGTPIPDLPITLNLDSGCRLCKWDKNFVGTVNTDTDGYAQFTLKNKNSAKEVLANTFLNSDTKVKEHGFVAFALLPTTNELVESVDEFWPQLVSDINVKSAAVQLTTLNRGGITADGSGNVVVGSGNNATVNPPLVIDEADNQLTDTNIINLNITYLKNSVPLALYAPDVKVSADNGGRFGLILPAHPVGDYASSTAQNSSYTFGYTYPQQIAVSCTKVGTTTFTIAVGTTKVTYPLECVLPANAASLIVGGAPKPALPGKANTTSFQVTDRFGNGISGIAVHVTTAGVGTAAGTDFTTDAQGFVTVPVSSVGAGAQTLTATASAQGSVFTVDTANAVVNWGAVGVTAVAAKGSVKFTVINAKGKTITVSEGKKKLASFKSNAASLAKAVKIAKGSHSLVVKAGSSSFSFSLVVK
jgi:hypothetical protein